MQKPRDTRKCMCTQRPSDVIKCRWIQRPGGTGRCWCTQQTDGYLKCRCAETKGYRLSKCMCNLRPRGTVTRFTPKEEEQLSLRQNNNDTWIHVSDQQNVKFHHDSNWCMNLRFQTKQKLSMTLPARKHEDEVLEQMKSYCPSNSEDIGNTSTWNLADICQTTRWHTATGQRFSSMHFVFFLHYLI
jgi:hypothetical protein